MRTSKITRRNSIGVLSGEDRKTKPVETEIIITGFAVESQA
jgi:hypothetical protein